MVLSRVAAAGGVLLASAVLAACGSSSSDSPTTAEKAPPPTASTADFPAAGQGRTLQDLQRGLPEGPIFAPSVSVLDTGTNRFGFALFDAGHNQISGAPVAMYVSRTDGSDLRGPYVARSESLKVSPQYMSKTAASDPDGAKTLYVADVPFRKKGKYAVTAIAQQDGKDFATTTYEVHVGAKGTQPPKAGERAPKIETLTRADVGGDLSKLDTRQPPAPELNEVDYADVLGKKPIALLFGTPQLCQSRVCGPVEDVFLEEQAKGHGDVQFIHQEIYNDNEVKKGFREQVSAFRLPTEPWVFVIDRDGVVRDRLEGAFSAGELQRALAKVEKQG